MVLLCAFLGDEGFEGLAEQGLVAFGARAYEIEQEVGAGHLTPFPRPTAAAGGRRLPVDPRPSEKEILTT